MSGDLGLAAVKENTAILARFWRFVELEADDEKKKELSEVRNVESSPIESVDLFENGDERRLVLNCELDRLVIETSLSHRWTRISPHPSVT